MTNHAEIGEGRCVPLHAFRDAATVPAADEELYGYVMRVARRLLRGSGQSPRRQLPTGNNALVHLKNALSLPEFAQCLTRALAKRSGNPRLDDAYRTEADTQMVRSIATRVG